MNNEDVNRYALGYQDWSKYKSCMLNDGSRATIKINWLPRKFMKKFMRKLWLHHPMKSYKMINRLMMIKNKHHENMDYPSNYR